MSVSRTSGVGPKGQQGATGPSGAVFVSLVTGNVSTSNTSAAPLVVGSAYVDPAVNASATNMSFEAVASLISGSGSAATNVVLFDLSTGSAVATLTSSSAGGEFVSQGSIPVPATARIYEARLYVSNAASSSTLAATSMVRLRFY